MFPPADDSQTNIQVQIGGNLEPGYVAILLFNCPLTMISDDHSPVPAMKLQARQAMEVAMNLIYFARMAEQMVANQNQSQPDLPSEAERCTVLTNHGQCDLQRGHTGPHWSEI